MPDKKFGGAAITERTTLFRLGSPRPTGAVLSPVPDSRLQTVSAMSLSQAEERVNLSYVLPPDVPVWGLGQVMGSLNRRGRRYTFYNTDDPVHTPDKESLYGSHPFLFWGAGEMAGLFIDCPGRIDVDCGFSDPNKLDITIHATEFDLYLIKAPTALELMKEYLNLVGRPVFPPRWAFGYQQSRWSYHSAEAVREVARRLRSNGIPCDAIYLDIDYMDHYKVFTIDAGRFPDFPRLSEELASQGIKLVAIVDPGIKVEEGYEAYESGKKLGVFCKDDEGSDYLAAVWPGLTHLPDFFTERCREWWAMRVQALVSLGISGVWNDMNEPAIFYTPRGLHEFREKIRGLMTRDCLTAEESQLVLTVPNRAMGDFLGYLRHDIEGESVPHSEVHSLYGNKMTAATVRGLADARPGERHLAITRSSYPGIHRDAAVWFGDNHSWWEHILLHLRMLQSMNLAGFFYCGADVGGFGGNASAELLIRWTQVGVLTPFFRNHAAHVTRCQEPYAFEDETTATLRNVIRLRYALLPYFYGEFANAVQTLSPFIMPLALHSPGPITRDIEDEFMVGRNLLAAPVHQQNARGRFVHLPGQKPWLLWKAAEFERRDLQVIQPGNHYLGVALNEVPLFLKADTLLPLAAPTNHTGESPIETLYVLGLVLEKAAYDYVDDDGVSCAGSTVTIRLSAEREGGGFAVAAAREGFRSLSAVSQVAFELWDSDGKKHEYLVKLAD